MELFDLELKILEAEKNDVGAMYWLAEYYRVDHVDIHKAIYWYQKALEKEDNPNFKLGLAMIYEQIDINESAKKGKNDNDHIEIELSFETNYWYKEALLSFEKEVKRGKWRSAYQVAEMYCQGDGCEIDYEKAFQYFKIVADQEMYGKSGLEKDLLKLACKRVAKMYKMGIGCEKNLENHDVYLKKSLGM